MIRVTVQAPQWAIDAGIAKEGDTDTDLFEDDEDTSEFEASGTLIDRHYVNADNDDEMFTLGYN